MENGFDLIELKGSGNYSKTDSAADYILIELFDEFFPKLIQECDLP